MIRTEQEIIESIKNAIRNETELSLRGNGTLVRGDLGNEVYGLGTYSGIVDYSQSERLLVAKAGTKIADIRTILSDNGQKLGFDPPDYCSFFASSHRGGATIGGVVAGNLSGHGVFHYGGVRDHVLGLRVCSGSGIVYKTGGKTVKNVSGFDITKMMIGSKGRLGVLCTVNLRTVPDTFEEITLCFEEPQVNVAASLARKLMRKPYSIIEASYLEGVLYLRLEGYQFDSIHQKLERSPNRLWRKDEGQSFWDNLRDGVHLKEMTANVPRAMVWQVRTAQTTGAKFLEQFLNSFAEGQGYFEWAGARVWLVLPHTHMEGLRNFVHRFQSEEKERISVQAFDVPKYLANHFIQTHLTEKEIQKEKEMWGRLRHIHDPQRVFKSSFAY